MGTKQLRINDAEQIRKRISEFIDKPISLVLTNGMIMSGKLTSVDASKVVVQNMRLKKIPYSFNQIAEIYFDSIA